MQHTRKVLEDLRRYIAQCDDRAELEEVDTLLDLALSDLRKKLASQHKKKLETR